MLQPTQALTISPWQVLYTLTYSIESIELSMTYSSLGLQKTLGLIFFQFKFGLLNFCWALSLLQTCLCNFKNIQKHFYNSYMFENLTNTPLFIMTFKPNWMLSLNNLCSNLNLITLQINLFVKVWFAQTLNFI